MRIYQQNENVLNTSKGFNTSSKYQHINSKDICNWFEGHGFTLEGISAASVRDPLKEGYQKHCMVFSRDDLVLDDGNKMQILALNSHDASTSLQITAGVYRAVCANGLVVGNDLYSERVIHIGDIKKQVEESLQIVASKANDLREIVKGMQGREVSFEESQEFLRYAADLRLNKVEDLYTVDLASIDKVRREADKGQDLYTVFNRIQESVIKGGIRYQTKKEFSEDGFGQPMPVFKNGTTRKINSIAEKVRLNKALWNQAEELLYA